ncbi:EAL domain-containing protein [Rhodoferax sp.]|uniref:EAL domain-containing protein n=1 Tax=Rhodoferax sp. TaxID=50421 RepID=UPI0028476FD3|nr:EAL domain-containing protein [Rhodoferax sp.]MDR3368329.1 EAL domain-containing protein [Rhodoferax sp.]
MMHETGLIGVLGALVLPNRQKVAMKSAKKLLMLVLFLLVALFLAGMGVMSSLNLSYSQDAMSALRARQIDETFRGNLDRIDARHQIMEKNAAALARLGELFYSMNRQSSQDRRAELEAALVKKIRDFPESSGGGIWFMPNAWFANTPLFAAYAGWTNNAVQLMPAYTASRYNYPHQSWYQDALAIWHDGKTDNTQAFHWAPTYYDEVQNDGLVTVSTPMLDSRGRLIGLATMSWRTNEIIRLVSSASVTPGSFSFLIDQNKHLLSSLSQTTESSVGQALMDALSKQEFNIAMPSGAASLRGGQIQMPMQTRQMAVQGRAYSMYLSYTRTGMVFGIGVPQDEIDAVLEPMRKTNYRIAIATGLVLLILSGVILNVVAKILRMLEALYTDRLTGLPNRTRLLRDTETPHDESIIQVNIDAFKEINDFYGHHCGDYILNSVSQRLQAYLDASPYRGRSSLYRLTGDEFAIRITSALDPEVLNTCLQEISEQIREGLFLWEEQEIAVNVTLGAVSTWNSEKSVPTSGETFLSSANMALKLARLQHRHYAVYDPALKVREAYEQNLLWAQRLKSALVEDRIVPYFQPIVSNSSGRTEKFECLVRLLDEQGMPVGPGQFLGVAKKLRLYGDITRLMVRKSMAVFKGTPYSFSLNLSFEDLTDSETTGFIKQLLRESGMGKQVIFEILESEGIQSYTEVRAFIDEVKAMGCSIAIDDFGSGYSNFDHLLRLNADIIKLDGSLIRNLDTDASALILIRGILQFAKELGFSTVAEYVHSASIQDRVQALGIDHSQGAFFSMPTATPMTEIKAQTKGSRGATLEIIT